MLSGFLQFKPAFCDADANIKKIENLLSKEEFDILVIPELANSGYLFTEARELEETAEEIPNGKFCRAIAAIAESKNAYIVSGIAERSNGKFYNSAILVHPDGKIITYRKIHLFYEESKWFKPGENKFKVYEIKVKDEKVKIGMMICYDWIYPESSRSLAIQGAQVICHPANLVMPYCQDAMYARALENRVFTITANRTGREKNKDKELLFTGQSVMLDPKGNYLKRAGEDTEECFITEIEPSMALDKRMNDFNSIFVDRRKDMYTL